MGILSATHIRALKKWTKERKEERKSNNIEISPEIQEKIDDEVNDLQKKYQKDKVYEETNPMKTLLQATDIANSISIAEKVNSKSKKKDVSKRMTAAYDKNKDKMNDDEPERDDSIARQNKIDDLEKRSHGKKISWSGLR
jgi:uncharacterized protein YqgV (UPF0045/DUF77 family)